MNETAKEAIKAGKAVLGIEFGSTRIKAVLVDGSHTPIAMGTYDWENRLENNIWTYSLEDIRKGLQGCYKSLADDVEAKYGEKLTTLGALGFSGMMHGYMPFNAEGELLVPFRTWRNTMTEEACKKLIPVFHFNIPPEMEHCPSVSGNLKRRRACKGYRIFHHPGRLHSLEAVR